MANIQYWNPGVQALRADCIPLHAVYDVVVVGAGAAGVAAATTLARKGHNILVIERYGFCGGGAVAGMSGTICGLYLSSDRNANRPEQVVFGFAEEFRNRLHSRGGLTEPQRYGKTWTVTHDPLMWREAADDLLTDAGAKILFHSRVVGVLRDGEAVRGVIVDTKSGMARIEARVVIDASGDADVVHRADWATTKGQDGIIQNPTMIFRLGGVDVARFLDYWGPDTISPEPIIQALIDAGISGNYELPRKKIWIFPTSRRDELLVNATRILAADGRDLDVTDPIDHSEAEIQARRQVREYARFLKDKVPGCESSFVNDTGVEVGIRQTRSIIGATRLRNSDVIDRRKTRDGVVRCPWPIELHAGDKPRVEWLLDDYYEIPYGTLVPEVGENVIVAGRCLSAEHEALASARVTAQCFGYGHAAAVAADIVIRDQVRFRDLRGADIRAVLNSEGSALD
jgi:glycine/D-amino acid oxidase-like deaminating enzyme